VATYLDLADELEHMVHSSSPGARVASEHELACEHAVSRVTARAALQELERRHLVRRVRGAGTFVARRLEYRISADMAPSWSDTVRAAGGEPYQEVLEVRTSTAGHEVRTALGLARGARVTSLTRRGWVDGEVASVSTSFLPAALVPDLAAHLHDGTSLYATLVQQYRYEPERLWCAAELVPVPAEVAEALRFEGRPPAWSLRSSNGCRIGGRVLELCTSWLRADVFRVVLCLGQEPPTHGSGWPLARSESTAQGTR
jgi:DNA-binding GntR family transcriptional regulator